jgi:hypothetical protein
LIKSKSIYQNYSGQSSVTVVLILLVFFTVSLAAQEKNILVTKFKPEVIQKVLQSKEKFHPFPQVGDEDWQGLPDLVKRTLVEKGRTGLNYIWPSLPATLFLEYARNGNRSNFQNVRSARREMLANLVLAECIEGRGRFLDDIVNGIWYICEESYWGVPAHLSLQRAGSGLPDVMEPTVDLFAAETSALLSWTDYLLGETLNSVSPLVRPRIELEIKKRILFPCLEREDFWWMGFGDRTNVNNWNPWINSNWLTTVLLMEQDQDRRLLALNKILKSLDNFLNNYPADGGCDEGPGYWGRAGASLFECLELLYRASDGKLNLYDNALIQEIGRYIYRVHIHNSYFVNFADASAKVNPDPNIVFSYGRSINDPEMTGFGAYLAKNAGDFFSTGSVGRRLSAIFNYQNLSNTEEIVPYLKDSWFPQLQVLTTRSKGGSPTGWYLAVKGGHNNESHNHNDVGNFIIYRDGEPVIIDVGVETYTKKTFSSERYDIWTMQSAYHNLPTIDGKMQSAGRYFSAKQVSSQIRDNFAEMHLDISGAYPPEAQLKYWKRTVRLIRGKEIQVSDEYALKKNVEEITLSLITPCLVTEFKKDQIDLNQTELNQIIKLKHPPDFKVKIEEIAIQDRRLKSVWGDNLYRILLIAEKPKQTNQWTLTFFQ